MNARRERLRAIGVEQIGPYGLLRLERGELEAGGPGQFFMLEAPGRVLPRPMSLCRAVPGELQFLVDPIGPGTRALCGLARGDAIHVFGPLGNGFDLNVRRPLLVAGGIGIAPMPYLAESLGGAPAILGFRSDRHAEAAELLPGATVVVEPRLVTELLPDDPGDVLACGPEPMLEAVRDSRSRGTTRVGSADGVWLRGLLRVRRRARRPIRPPLRRGADPAGRRVSGHVLPPILNASGCLDALTAPSVANRLDAFVTKTVTPLPRDGNPPPRIAETESGMLNSIGLQNPGIDAFVRDSLPRLAALDVPVWVSVGGFSAEDYALACTRLDECAEVSRIELNLSCPNVEEAAETAAELVAAARQATAKPLYAKLSPATWDVAESARAVAEAGADGLSLVNTIRGLAFDRVTGRPLLARGAGGYSGPALRPIALACVYACAQAVELPIVGMGGIGSGRDIEDFVSAGATSVALGTILFSDPWAPDRLRSELGAASGSDADEVPGRVSESVA